MTSYIAITNAETDPEAPLTSELAKKWRDNPLAIAEADASAPVSLLPTVLLGTITTTSGTTQTLSDLVLTPYKLLRLVISSVSGSTTATSLALQASNASISSNLGANAAQVWRGIVEVDLSSGVYSANVALTTSSANTSGASSPYGGTCGITNATTSVSILAQGGGSFDAGSVLVYGVK